MRKIVSQEEKEEWKNRYLAGETARAIAKDFPQYNENTISRHIKKMGISRGRGKSFELEKIKPTILKEYQEDKYATCSSLARKYKLSDKTISTWLKQENIEIKNTSGTISHCNEEYFDIIDTPNKAYLLGFITADGAVVQKKNCNAKACSIEVNEKDRELILFAQKEINPQAAITKCDYNNKNNVRISFSSTKLCNALEQYGIIQNKSKTIKEVPINLIPNNLLPYYFRGLIDGDGYIGQDGRIAIYSGSYDFIKNVQNILCDQLKVKKLKIYQGTTYFISWSSKSDREKFFHYLYDNLEETFYYQRKYIRLYNSLYDNTEVTNQIAKG